jgi:hypothetical protein
MGLLFLLILGKDMNRNSSLIPRIPFVKIATVCLLPAPIENDNTDH